MARETDLIKSKVDLVEFLKGYIELTPAGKNLKALCPFHQEKTPSFIVSPDRGRWRCFGACGEGGDIFTFLMKHENIEFHEALKTLAERAGVPLREIDPRQQKEFGVLYDINEEAKNFYVASLKNNDEALDYLLSRGLKEETVKELDIGYAEGGETLVLHLLDKGYDIEAIVRAGLAKKNVQGLYRDSLFGRITFPISSSMGKTVAFTGRILPSVEKRLTFEMPKYLNSPETPIFNKSKILYGLDKSKRDISKLRSVFLVEGQMDFVMAWQSGVRNVVAVSGTGLTVYHCTKLRRIADTIIIGLDNDEAGIRAMERSLDILSPFDFHIKAVDLGEYDDPADACLDDPNFLSKAIDCAVPAFKYLFESSFASLEKDDVPSKKRLVASLLGKIRGLRSGVEREAWVEELSRVSGISKTTLDNEMENASSLLYEKKQHSTDDRNGENNETFSSYGRRGKIVERLFILAYAYEELFAMIKEYRDLLPKECLNILDDLSEEQADELKMRSSHESKHNTNKDAKEEFENLLKHLKYETLRDKQNELRIEIRMESGDASRAMKDLESVSKEIDEIRKS